MYRGEEYRIDNDVAQYKPKRTAVGLLYDMDKILCVTRLPGDRHASSNLAAPAKDAFSNFKQ